MGNSSSKDDRKAAHARPGPRHTSSSAAHDDRTQQSQALTAADGQVYGSRGGNGSSGRASRLDLSSLLRDRSDDKPTERPRETRQEREARKKERERQARVKERERSLKEESIDGGYLVTLGTYTGPEDFNKGIVRQLQIERRLAPFWKGLNDHSDTWTEAQLVAAVRGLPMPAPDEIPSYAERSGSHDNQSVGTFDMRVNGLTVPITGRSHSYQSDASANLSTSYPVSLNTSSSSAALLRGRAKTLASLATGKGGSSTDLTPRETQLPKDPYVNGLPIEAYLYREAAECPICFLYYPPFLNKTRCCDQAICSECFVQIKRPDPHPPEHEQPGQPRPPEEEAEMLVSEVAACPFCVQPEFGVTYEPPPFRRGLAYANHASSHPLKSLNSAMSSSSSLQSAGRRRATSISANAPNVITTDRVRPDWAKKLSDARAHALRRSAAATALHNAAYVLGNQGESSRSGLLGRRRRTLFVESPNASGSGTPPTGEDPNGDPFSGRAGTRRNRVDDLEELMMMEAIRLSLAAEEDRKKKEEKEAKKEEKKKAKENKKEAKMAEKARKRNGSGASLYPIGTNDSTSSWATSSMARSTSNLGTQPTIPEEHVEGKGKAPVQDFAGFNPLREPSSTLNTEMLDGISEQYSTPSPHYNTSNPIDNPQRHLNISRANLQPASGPIPTPSPRSLHNRHLSNASSANSSFVDSAPGSFRQDSHMFGTLNIDDSPDGSPFATATPTPIAGPEPMLNFQSLAAMIGRENKVHGSEHVEHAAPDSQAAQHVNEPVPTAPSRVAGVNSETRSRGDSGESSASSAPPPIYIEHTAGQVGCGADLSDQIEQAPPAPSARIINDEKKEYGNVDIQKVSLHEATQ
ncbi:c2h2 zinc finger protein [Teratosphaeria destructans]|uniref:C2h2 zinc finger protein n=1 Tax=Teratosphaeria destructans TaxID=418781 RepID=A0A9W7SN21_9PEZI|nr:c2h2 zinc finger protein [Teratosphaeria destructans]